MKTRCVLAAAVLLTVAGCATTADFRQVVADDTRPEDHRVRDDGRKPAEVLAFGLPGIGEGSVVLDLVPGGGYYTAILSRAVGETGKVYAVDPTRIFEYFPAARDGFKKYLESDPRSNVEYSVQKLDALRLPEPVDAAMLVLYYHDTIWTGVDRTTMNRAVFDALKPGGTYLVVDHHAVVGAGDDVTRQLHRMDHSGVRSEITKVGFVFVGESDVLANPADPRTGSVFDEAIRGKTDRFMYLFKKPRGIGFRLRGGSRD